MDSSGFTENVSEWKWTDNATDALISNVHCDNADPVWSIWPFFYWLHGLSRLLIGGLPRTETEHPTINHRWSVRRARILYFLQHCNKHPMAAARSSVLVWQKLGRIDRSDKTVILDWLTVAATGDIWNVFCECKPLFMFCLGHCNDGWIIVFYCIVL